MVFDLEKAIAAWRRPFEHNRAFSDEDIEELEGSLRDRIEALVERGLSEEAAFREALRRMGDYGTAEEEYRKVYWEKLRRRRQLRHKLIWRCSMLKNYLKIAVRTLLRQKGYSFINIAGLTLGLASCLMIFQYVAFEYSFDRFHEHEPDLYRVIQTVARSGDEFVPGGPYTAYALGPKLAEEVPEILRSARLHPDGAVVSNPAQPERVFEEERVFYTEPAFLKMFSFPLVAGDTGTALEPGTILLSETAAEKYFGTADPIGQVLDWTGTTQRSYRVTGVFRDVPANSHLQFDFLLPIENLLREYYRFPESAWHWNNFITYVQLRPDVDPAAVERKMMGVYKHHLGERLREHGLKARVYAQPLRDVHLNADIFAPTEAVLGSYRTVYFFTVIGLVTLLIALINYVNLATARSLERAREVGVRKVVGAQRRELIVQFLSESALSIFTAFVLAVALTVMLMPVANDLAGTSLTKAVWMNTGFGAAFLATFLITTLLAGLYPAFVLSSFRPVAVLKGKVGTFAERAWLRRGLVVLQFAASVVLLIGTTVIYTQLGFMREMDLGLDLEQVLTVEGPRVLPEGTDRATAMATFTQELQRLPAVRQVATSSSLPGQGFSWTGTRFRRTEADPVGGAMEGVVTFIDTSFAELYGLELVAGKGFSHITSPEAEDAPWPVIANETAVRTLGFDSPADAVDQALNLNGNNARIVGVFKDFNWSSAHEARQNIFFRHTSGGRLVSLRISTEDLSGTIDAVEALYARLFPGNIFNYAFADEAFDQQYRGEERFAKLFMLFAALAVAIACLGLFGLASFTAEQRTKEIGVRKVLGATVPQIVGLLSKDFLKLVGIAFVVAVPLGYFAMQRWLESFAYRIEVGLGIFVLTGVLVLLLVLLTVSYQSIKAALVDPVKSLRHE